MQRILLFSVAVLVALAAQACEQQQREHQLVSQVESTPLELDPTEHIELARWWSNGKEMLRLNDDASYSLYTDQNRWHAPRERGRWSQENYFRAWLEPYNSRGAERVRMGISKVDGNVSLAVDGLAPMRAIQRPPVTLEDRLTGQWNGPVGTLSLGDDGRYVLTPAAASQSQPLVRAGVAGSWRVVAKELVLQPDVAGDAPTRWPIAADDKAVMIKTSDGVLSRK